MTELERQLKIANYERDGLQKRLDLIRGHRDALITLLDTTTLAEHLEAGGDVVDYIEGKPKKRTRKHGHAG